MVGFDLVGIAPAVTPTGFHDFRAWIDSGNAGEMEYLPRREAAYEHPQHVLTGVKSLIMLAVNYHTEQPAAVEPGEGRVSRYAWGETDYHTVLRNRLGRLADFVHEESPGCRTRGVVDTAPLLERDFARMAGLGWFGKNTMLINKRLGSWSFLAAILVDLELDYDEPHAASHCGTCTRCLEACPTDAFTEPYVLDASRCISYLNIELSGPVPAGLREPMGDWLFGCDVCQDVCPWNHKAPESDDPAFASSDGSRAIDAIALLELDEAELMARFEKTPLARPKRSGILRNAAIVLGNSGDTKAVPCLARALGDTDPVVRSAAAWALGRLGGESAAQALRLRSEVEHDDQVCAELTTALLSV